MYTQTNPRMSDTEARKRVGAGEIVYLVWDLGRMFLFSEGQEEWAEAFAAEREVRILDFETGEYADL